MATLLAQYLTNIWVNCLTLSCHGHQQIIMCHPGKKAKFVIGNIKDRLVCFAWLDFSYWNNHSETTVL